MDGAAQPVGLDQPSLFPQFITHILLRDICDPCANRQFRSGDDLCLHAADTAHGIEQLCAPRGFVEIIAREPPSAHRFPGEDFHSCLDYSRPAWSRANCWRTAAGSSMMRRLNGEAAMSKTWRTPLS